jgi:hypothetical protein
MTMNTATALPPVEREKLVALLRLQLDDLRRHEPAVVARADESALAELRARFEALERLVDWLQGVISEPTTYHFQIVRDSQGRLSEITATPIR